MTSGEITMTAVHLWQSEQRLWKNVNIPLVNANELRDEHVVPSAI